MAMFHSLLNPIIYGTFSRKAIAKTVRTSFAKRNKEKIVIDVSLGSDFDSLVFVTNPDLYMTNESEAGTPTQKKRGCHVSQLGLEAAGKGLHGVRISLFGRVVSVMGLNEPGRDFADTLIVMAQRLT